MRIIIAKKTTNNDMFSVVLFLLYNIIYVSYMQAWVPRILYLCCLMLFIVYNLFGIIYAGSGKLSLSKGNFGDGLSYMLSAAAILYTITFAIQIKNQNLQLYSIVQILYLVLPAVLVYSIAGGNEKNWDSYIYISLGRVILQFVIEEGKNFSIDNLMLINWLDSNSSATESSLAHAFLCFTVMFLWRKQRKLAALCTFFCLISFKRLCLLFCIAAWLVIPRLPEKKVSGKILTITGIAFCVSPLVMLWLYSTDGADFFLRFFGIRIDDFTMSRYTLVNMALSEFQGQYNGYGCISDYFANLSPYYATVGSIHCDVLVLYLECTIIGVIVYFYYNLRIMKENYCVFYLGVYFLLETVVSQFINGIFEWTLLFIFVCTVRNEKELKKQYICKTKIVK